MAGSPLSERGAGSPPEENTPGGRVLSRRDFLKLSVKGTLGAFASFNPGLRALANFLAPSDSDQSVGKEAATLGNLGILPESVINVPDKNGRKSTIYFNSRNIDSLLPQHSPDEQYALVAIKNIDRRVAQGLTDLLSGRVKLNHAGEGFLMGAAIGGGSGAGVVGLAPKKSPHRHDYGAEDIAIGGLGIAAGLTAGGIAGYEIGRRKEYYRSLPQEERSRLFANLPIPLTTVLRFIFGLDQVNTNNLNPGTVDLPGGQMTVTPKPSVVFTTTPDFLQASPPPTVEITPTSEPLMFQSSDWATVKEGEKQGLVDPQIMFPMVGSINHKNRQFIDLSFGPLAVAYDTKQDLSQVTNHSQMRGDAIQQLDLNAELKADLVKFINFIQEEKNKPVTERIVVQTDPSKFTVVIEDNKVTQIIERNSEQDIRRYVIDGDKNLRRLSKEEEPQLFPTLFAKEGFNTDSYAVQLTGAVHPLFVMNVDFRLNTVIKDIDKLREMGGHFIVIQWNASEADSYSYVDDVVKALEYARMKGFRTALVLHSDGYKINPSWQAKEIRLARDGANLLEAWKKFLGHDSIAARLAKSVDIFTPWAEPNEDESGNKISWRQWIPIAEDVIREIRRATKTNAIGSISGINYAGNPWEVFSYPPVLDNVCVEVHPYDWNTDLISLESHIKRAKEKGITLWVGEAGHEDDYSFLFGSPTDPEDGLFDKFEKYGISFSVYAINSDTTNPRAIVNKSGETEFGKQVKTYFYGLDEVNNG